MKKILLITILALCFSCSSDDSDNPPIDNTLLEANLVAYINGEVDGVLFKSSISSDVTQNTNYGGSMSYQPQNDNSGACYNINYEPSLYPAFDESVPNMGVGFIGFVQHEGFDCFDEGTDFESFFPVNTYGYASDAYGYGVKVNYATSSDANQVYYNTYGGPQTNSTFEIVSIEVNDCGFKKCATVTGTFSCRVYRESDTSDFKDITNGVFKLDVISFY